MLLLFSSRRGIIPMYVRTSSCFQILQDKSGGAPPAASALNPSGSGVRRLFEADVSRHVGEPSYHTSERNL